jgi:hypothetical protein
MRVADTVTPDREDWLAGILQKYSDDVLKLYLVYNDHKFGPDTAREIWDKVTGGDFVPTEDGEIISNERILAERQQGMDHMAPPTMREETHHWWLEVYVQDVELWEVIT